MTDKEAQELLQRIRDGAERGKALAARRPDWATLGSALYQIRNLVTTALIEPAGGPSDHPGFLGFPMAGSPGESEQFSGVASNVNPGNSLVLETLDFYLRGTLDHLGGLGLLMSANPPLRSALALSRVLLDASAHGLYLLRPLAEPSERAIRAVNIRLEAIRQQIGDFDLADDAEDVDLLESERKGLLDHGDQDGLPRVLSNKGVAQSYFSPKTPLVGRLVDDALDEPGIGGQAWRYLSSVVHVQERPLLRFTLGLGEIDQRVHGPTYAALHMIPAILVTGKFLNCAWAYYGLPSGDGVSLYHLLELLYRLWGLGAGLADDELVEPN